MLWKQHILISGFGSAFVGLVTIVAAYSLPEAPEAAEPSGYAMRLLSAVDTDPVSDLIAITPRRIGLAKDKALEQKCLAEAIYYEARSETLTGQKAVAEVVLNRARSRHFPDTICGVVYQGSERKTGCQFSFTCDGSMDRTPKGRSWARSKDVASLAISKGAGQYTKRATHYHTTAVNPKWSSKLVKTDQYGTHVFYRFKTQREIRESQSAAMLDVAPPS